MDDPTAALMQRLYDADQERHAVLYSVCECGHAVHEHQDLWWACKHRVRCLCNGFRVVDPCTVGLGG